jgi:hypothetical protein
MKYNYKNKKGEITNMNQAGSYLRWGQIVGTDTALRSRKVASRLKSSHPLTVSLPMKEGKGP